MPILRRGLSLTAVVAVAAAVVIIPTSASAAPGLSALQFNEIETDGSPDWVELINTGATSVDAAGAVITSVGNAGNQVLPSPSVVPAGGVLLVNLSFGLKKNDTVTLFDTDGTTELDQHAWGDFHLQTHGRIPDGTGAFTALPAASPGALNADLTVLRVNEIETDGSPDWVELFNTGATAVDATGAVIRSVGNAGHQVLSSPAIVPAGGVLLVNLSFGLKKNDTLTLLAADDTTQLDQYTWGDFHLHTWGRTPDGTGPFALLPTASPGALNAADPGPEPSAGSILINEVDSAPDDWVELVNAGSDAVDISDYELRDKDDDHRWRFAAGTTIAAGAFLVVEGATVGQVWDGSAWVAGTFAGGVGGIGSDDRIRLYDAGGELIDQTFQWSKHAFVDTESNGSYARCVDGVGGFLQASKTKGASNAGSCALPSVALNEINPSGADWVEVINTGDATVDLSGWYILDGDVSHTVAQTNPLPAGTTLAAGARFVFLGETSAERHFQFGLSNNAGESVTLRTSTGTAVDSYGWSVGISATVGRCPEGTGAWDAQSATQGTANTCGDTGPAPEPEGRVWPGSTAVTVLDPTPTFLEDSSGLDTWTDETGTYLYAIDNGSGGTFWKLAVDADGSIAFAPGWADGKRVRFQKDAADAGAAGPDTEGITVDGEGFVYAASERDNASNGVNWNVILKVDPEAAGPDLVAIDEWDLTSALPAVDANLGIEAVEWVADADLAGRLWDTTRSKAYAPADYPGHGDGLFFVALEDNGHVYGFALRPDGEYELVTDIDPGLGAAMALDYDTVLDVLWVVCDDGCLGSSAQLTFNGTATPGRSVVARPAGMPNLNNEGFATAPAELISGGQRAVWWFADGSPSQSLRTGTLTARNTAPPVALADLTSANQGDLAAPSTATAGQTVTIGADPALAGEVIEVWLYSTPTLVATGTLGASGSIAVTIPAGTPAGAHHLVVVAAGTSTVYGWAGISVAALGLAITGFETTALVLTALALLLAGGAAVLGSRRRRSA